MQIFTKHCPKTKIEGISTSDINVQITSADTFTVTSEHQFQP